MEILSYIVVGMFIEHFIGLAGKIVEIAYNYIKR